MPQATGKVAPANCSVFAVCIDRVCQMEMAGRIFSRLAGQAPFEGVVDLMGTLQGLLDWAQFPQNTHEMRSFDKKRNGSRRAAGFRWEEILVASMDSVLEAKGEKATFLIQIKFRQNASWQGTIHWVDNDKKQNFRSTLELIKLMDEALEQSETVECAGWEEPEL